MKPSWRFSRSPHPTNTPTALTDQLGSIRTLLNSTGAVVRRYRYQPYGADDPPTGSWTTTPIQYADGPLDSTGLYHYYDPNTMRWTQQDPRTIGGAADAIRFFIKNKNVFVPYVAASCAVYSGVRRVTK